MHWMSDDLRTSIQPIQPLVFLQALEAFPPLLAGEARARIPREHSHIEPPNRDWSATVSKNKPFTHTYVGIFPDAETFLPLLGGVVPSRGSARGEEVVPPSNVGCWMFSEVDGKEFVSPAA